jgi:mRNA interferase RelE/StbE
MKIIYERSFLKDIQKISDKNLLDKIDIMIESVKKATEINEIKNIKKLKGHTTAYRMRLGDYRLGFFLENNALIFTRFLHRKEIYRLFP